MRAIHHIDGNPLNNEISNLREVEFPVPMDKHGFINRVRSLYNIDGYLLPELSEEEQAQFIRNPSRYLMHADKGQSDAIWREVEKRQRS